MRSISWRGMMTVIFWAATVPASRSVAERATTMRRSILGMA
jgi:hypothetical protein